MGEFASKGVAGAGLGTGIAGLSLGVLNSGLLPNLFGGGYNVNNPPVSRYELNLTQELAAKDARIGLLEADKYTDQKIVEATTFLMGELKELSKEVRANKDAQTALNLEQAVYNGTNTAAVGCLKNDIAALRSIVGGITKTVVPNDTICPGWGPVRVVLETTANGTT